MSDILNDLLTVHIFKTLLQKVYNFNKLKMLREVVSHIFTSP